MPRQATASVRYRRNQWEARVTVAAKTRRSFKLPTCKSEPEAKERGQVLAEVAQKLRAAGHEDVAPRFVARAAEAEAVEITAIVEAVERVCSGRVVIPGKEKREITFREFGE